jgi:LysM repeat protein
MAMSEANEKPADVIQAYRKRRDRMLPLLLGGLAVVLLVVGLFLVVLWLTGDNPPTMPAFLASSTPTATFTETPPPPTSTPTITETLPPSETPTPEGPLTYVVQEGDFLSTIADEFGVDVFVLMSVNGISNPDEIFVGQQLTIPTGDDVLPTDTPLPEDLFPGQKIEYRVLPGDTLETIAAKFNSTAEAIAEENEIDDPNNIGVGQILVVPVNIATSTPTFTPVPATATSEATATTDE